jgi:hypothetical protein
VAKSPRGTASRAGLPDPASIVSTGTLVSPKGTAAAPAPGAAAPSGAGTYRILRTREMDPYDTPVPDADIPSLAAAAKPASDDFQGTARKAAKLSIATAATEDFGDLKDLIASLPAETAMTKHKPAISTIATSSRVKEEERNVRVRAFIYAASREADNDFHLIVGRAPGQSPSLYMTMELSALPPHSSPAFARLNAARSAYKAFFANLPGLTYDFYDPPVPIEVEGSLFFDMSHAHGLRPGPPSLHQDMPVIWEVHPISKITFEP